MPYRGYWELNCAELANSSRVVSHLTGAGCASCRRLVVPYDDTWPGLVYAPEPPWMNEAVPQSSEFAGVWVMDVRGLDGVPIQRDVTELVCSGAAAGPHRDNSRTIEFEALVVGCTNAGARFGLNWLNCQLRAATMAGGVEMNYYAAHPEEETVDPETLWRNVRSCVLTAPATVSEYSGKGGSNRHRQASVLRVVWSLTALNPYVFGPARTADVIWDAVEALPIEWVHAPDCESPLDCALPVLFAAGCEPQQINVTAAVPPLCSGCLPVCEIETRRWAMAADPGVQCWDSVMSTRITNTHPTEPLTAHFHWRPVGSTDICDRVGEMSINGLAPYATAVADAVGGRPYVILDSQRVRQVGIVTGQSGAPWSPLSLDRSLPWELVAESEPGATYNVSVTSQEREP
jgi:hypothetical protein